MAIRYLKTYAALEGHLGAEDAEGLLAWLRSKPRPSVQLSRCESLHTAILQTLLAAAPVIKAPPADPWLCKALGLPSTSTSEGSAP